MILLRSILFWLAIQCYCIGVSSIAARNLGKSPRSFNNQTSSVASAVESPVVLPPQSSPLPTSIKQSDDATPESAPPAVPVLEDEDSAMTPPPFPPTVDPDPEDTDAYPVPPEMPDYEPDPADTGGVEPTTSSTTGTSRLHTNGTSFLSTRSSSTTRAPRPSKTTSSCTSLKEGETPTTYEILPNPTTITITITAGGSQTTRPLITLMPEFTPPVYCEEPPPPEPPTLSTSISKGSTTTADGPYIGTGTGAPPETTTIITTSKNPVFITTTVNIPSYPGSGATDKESVEAPGDPDPTQAPAEFPSAGVEPPFSAVITVPVPGIVIGKPLSSPWTYAPTTAIVGNLPVIIQPTKIIIGTHIIAPVSSEITITAGQNTFTINPSQVIAPGTTFTIPAKPAEVDVIITAGQTAPPEPQSTNFVIIGGESFTVIGDSVAIIGGSTITYNPSLPAVTTIFNHETITIGPSGVYFDATILGAVTNPDTNLNSNSDSNTQYGLAGGLTVSQIGPSIAVIHQTTLTIGPQAVLTTVIIDEYTITAAPSGLVVNGMTLTYPYNPTTKTHVADGLTFTEIGSSIVVLAGTTYTFGPGATITSLVIDGKTISIGPSGVGVLPIGGSITATTSTELKTATAAAAEQTNKENGSSHARSIGGIYLWLWGSGTALYAACYF